MLIPMLPYFVTHFGASPVVVGLLMSTFSLCQLAAAPLWGYASDRIGRKTVLIVSQIGATIGWAMLGLAPNIAAALAVAPIAIVFAARIVEGISGGNISITQAYVADLVVPKDRARAFGLIGAMFAAGMVFGPAGGGILYARFRVRGALPRCRRAAVRDPASDDHDASRIARANQRGGTSRLQARSYGASPNPRLGRAFSGRSLRSRSHSTDGSRSSRSSCSASWPSIFRRRTISFRSSPSSTSR